MLGIVQVMAPLRHANLVCMLGACWDDGPDKLALILEYCPNGSLEDLLEIEGQHSSHTWESPFYDIVLGIARCFKYLHHEQSGNPLIHRDLKPANVLITNDLRAKVADFGESTRFDEEQAKESKHGFLTMTQASSNNLSSTDDAPLIEFLCGIVIAGWLAYVHRCRDLDRFKVRRLC